MHLCRLVEDTASKRRRHLAPRLASGFSQPHCGKLRRSAGHGLLRSFGASRCWPSEPQRQASGLSAGAPWELSGTRPKDVAIRNCVLHRSPRGSRRVTIRGCARGFHAPRPDVDLWRQWTRHRHAPVQDPAPVPREHRARRRNRLLPAEVPDPQGALLRVGRAGHGNLGAVGKAADFRSRFPRRPRSQARPAAAGRRVAGPASPRRTGGPRPRARIGAAERRTGCGAERRAAGRAAARPRAPRADAAAARRAAHGRGRAGFRAPHRRAESAPPSPGGRGGGQRGDGVARGPARSAHLLLLAARSAAGDLHRARRGHACSARQPHRRHRRHGPARPDAVARTAERQFRSAAARSGRARPRRPGLRGGRLPGRGPAGVPRARRLPQQVRGRHRGPRRGAGRRAVGRDARGPAAVLAGPARQPDHPVVPAPLRRAPARPANGLCTGGARTRRTCRRSSRSAGNARPTSLDTRLALRAVPAQ